MKQFSTLILFGIILFLGQPTHAQRTCAHDENHERLIEQYPEFSQAMESIERHTRNFLENDPITSRSVVTIPVVVHILYKNNSQNISDAQVLSQIDVLNEDFRRLNADADNTWPQATDAMIEFCLATQDPDGNSTSGIQRRKTNKPSFSANDQMKFFSSGGLNAWPTGEYLNIWVCNLNSFLGYAQFPGGPANTDGVVCDYAYFGSGGSAQSPFDLGRTATHEVGHWLNLRHIWGDGGCGVDDFIGDTPQSDGPNYGCALGHLSCGSVDMVQNYMDYSDDACMNLFTSGQESRMNALFSAGGFRASLLNSNGCNGGTTPTCNDGIQNGDEEGIDCGGSCPTPCEVEGNCSDGIQNGDEEGIDCGGSCPTPCDSGVCEVPAGTQATSIKKKNAKLNWNSASGASSYTARYRVANSSGSWENKSTTSTVVTATGLSNGSTYEWQVRSNCNGSQSAWSALCTFIAGNGGSSNCSGARQNFATIALAPNPASQSVHVQWSNVRSSQSQMVIYNAVGKIMITTQVDDEQGFVRVDLSNWSPGVYIVRMSTDRGEHIMEKLIVQ